MVLCVNLMDLNCSISYVTPEKVSLADQKILGGVIGYLLFSHGYVLFRSLTARGKGQLLSGKADETFDLGFEDSWKSHASEAFEEQEGL